MGFAVMGAILCGDASEMVTHPDRYKLLAVHAHLTGMPPAQVHEAISEHIRQDAFNEARARGLTPGHIMQEMGVALGTHPAPEYLAAAILESVHRQGFRG
jgi:hypothetical protein